MEALNATFWYIVNLAIIFTAWNTARRTFPTDNPGQWTLHTAVLLWAWIVCASFLVGTLGIINAINLGISVLLLGWGTHFWFTKKFENSNTSEEIISRKQYKREWYTTFGGIAWAGLASLAGALVITQGLLQFPNDWDTLAYHRPLIDHWLQTGCLHVPGCAVWHVPANNELMGLWWAVAFSGDFWVGLVNIPAVLLLVLGTFELGRLVELTPLLQHSTALAIVASTIVLRQLTDVENDIAVGGLFVAGIAYCFRFIQGKHKGNLILAGVSLGLLAGVKYYALGYAAIGWMGFFAIAWFRYGRRVALIAAGTTIGLMVLLGGYWYGRNIIVTGTPLYPVGYSGENSVEAKVPRSVWKSSLIGNGRTAPWPQYVESVWKMTGPCQGVSILVFPLSLSWLIGSGLILLKQEKFLKRTALRWGLAFFLLGGLVVFGVTPFTIDPSNALAIKGPYILVRFSQVLLAISVLTFSLLLSDISRWIQGTGKPGCFQFLMSVLLPGLFSATAITQFGLTATHTLNDEPLLILLVFLNLILLALGLCEFYRFTKENSFGIRWASMSVFSAIGLIAFVLSSVWLSNWWHGNFASHYDSKFGTKAFTMLEDWNGSDTSIATIHYRYYPFFGSRRQFRPRRPRWVPSKQFLLNYLIAHEIDLVSVLQDDWFKFARYQGAIGWIEQNPRIFERIESGSRFNVYSIRKEQLQQQWNVDRGALL